MSIEALKALGFTGTHYETFGCAVLMKICAFSTYTIDSPSSGGEVRVFEMLRHLARLGNEVNLIVPGPDYQTCFLSGVKVTVVPYPRLLRMAALSRGARALISKLKATYGYNSLLGANPNMLRYARNIVKASEVVFFFDRFQLLSLIYARLCGKVCIMDLFGFFLYYFAYHFRLLLKRPMALARLLPTILAETFMIKLADYTIVSSWEDERNSVRALHLEDDRVFLIPDGIDPDDFRPSIHDREVIRRSLGIDDDCTVIAFVGNMRSPHNYYAAKFIVETLAPDLISRISPFRTNVRFLIIGPYDSLPDEWLRKPFTIFTGYVDNVGKFVNAADICVSPLLYGTGMKTKTLGYLACGKAVVTTPVGAEGLRLVHGRDALICDLDSIGYELARLVVDPSLRRSLEARAREKVVSYSWKETARTLHETLKVLLDRVR